MLIWNWLSLAAFGSSGCGSAENNSMQHIFRSYSSYRQQIVVGNKSGAGCQFAILLNQTKTVELFACIIPISKSWSFRRSMLRWKWNHSEVSFSFFMHRISEEIRSGNKIGTWNLKLELTINSFELLNSSYYLLLKPEIKIQIYRWYRSLPLWQLISNYRK